MVFNLSSMLQKNFVHTENIKFYFTFPKRKNLDTSKYKEIADDIFKFDENDRKFSKRIENTVGKGEIAC